MIGLVTVEVFEPRPWGLARAATSKLAESVRLQGNPRHFRLVRIVSDATVRPSESARYRRFERIYR
jgi:hypothetical protein